MKRILKNYFFLTCLVTVFFLPFFVLAQEGTTPVGGELKTVEPLVFLPVVGSATSIQALLTGLFELSMALAAVLAVVMIAVGGFEYMGSDVISNKSAGRERMVNAVLGLILILGAYIILNTINPNLLSFNIFTQDAYKINTRTIPTSAHAPAPVGSTEGTAPGPAVTPGGGTIGPI